MMKPPIRMLRFTMQTHLSPLGTRFRPRWRHEPLPLLRLLLQLRRISE
jgi:hypothetical protein